MDHSELLTMETAVLRTFCLSVNSETSELKAQITDNLVVDNFYFPITKSIFGTIAALSKNGMNVDPNSLLQALTSRSVDVPDDFFLEDLFRGEAPSADTLSEWINDLSSANVSSANVSSGNGDEPVVQEESTDNQVHYLEKTQPSVKVKSAPTPPKTAPTPPKTAPTPAKAASTPAKAAPTPEAAPTAPEPALSESPDSATLIDLVESPEPPALTPPAIAEAASAPPPSPARAEPAKPERAAPAKVKKAVKATAATKKSSPRPDAGVSDAKRNTDAGAASKAATAHGVLAPESGEWLGYLAELTKKQGEHLKTGFSGLDAEWGGLGSGLLLIAGEERHRLADFLKQLVDQIAVRCRVPVLYLSFERSKADLRLYTLSRLSEAPATHIRDGRYDKDSAEWQSIIRAGEQAVEWLQRIFTVEATPGLAVTGIRELRQGLIDSGAGATCLIAIDNLQKLASKNDLLQSVAELKELAESLGIVVVGVADNVELVHERSADMAIKFAEVEGASVLEVHTQGVNKPTLLRFDFHPDTHRFEERL